MAMICGRCDQLIVGDEKWSTCGSTGNLDHPEEILCLHHVCPTRNAYALCFDGNHAKYYGSCCCRESKICDYCEHCLTCEQYSTFGPSERKKKIDAEYDVWRNKYDLACCQRLLLLCLHELARHDSDFQHITSKELIQEIWQALVHPEVMYQIIRERIQPER